MMKVLVSALVFSMSIVANASSFSFEEVVHRSQTIRSLLQGIQSDYAVTCDPLAIVADAPNDRFTAKTTCLGKDAYGVVYGVEVDIRGDIIEQFAYIANISLQYTSADVPSGSKL